METDVYHINNRLCSQNVFKISGCCLCAAFKSQPIIHGRLCYLSGFLTVPLELAAFLVQSIPI